MAVPTYPTPLIEDTIEIEYIDSVAGVYNPIPFGTKYNGVEHGMNSKNLPDHVLVADTAADTTGVMRKRTWVSNRTDQDKYNFAIAYENSESNFPNYTRVYVLPREGYTPKELLTADSFDPYAFLVAEQVLNETDPPELRNQYVKVVRMYNTLPGPISYALEYPYGGNPSYPRITTKQKFSHMEFPQSSGTKCPLINYTEAILIGQTIQQTEIWAIDLVTRIYDVVPNVTYGEPPGTGDDYGGAGRIWLFHWPHLWDAAVSLPDLEVFVEKINTCRLWISPLSGSGLRDPCVSSMKRFPPMTSKARSCGWSAATRLVLVR
jgi:hypothetical protein